MSAIIVLGEGSPVSDKIRLKKKKRFVEFSLGDSLHSPVEVQKNILQIPRNLKELFLTHKYFPKSKS